MAPGQCILCRMRGFNTASPCEPELQEPRVTKKSRLAAFLFSLLQPGFGHFYAGCPRRAAVLLAMASATTFALFTGLIGRSLSTLALAAGLALSVFVFSAIDAPRQASKARTGNPLYARWYVVLPAAFIFQLLLVTILPRVQRIKSFYIPSGSMEPTLMVKDRLVAALERGIVPSRNEIVIFQSPENPSALQVSRVVALAGDVIELRDKQLIRNATAVLEPWVVHGDPRVAGTDDFGSALRQRDQLSPTTVPAGHMFVMSDNRDFSYDSRFFGPVPVELVRGRPLYLYWSPNRSRIGRRLDRVDPAADSNGVGR